MLSDYQQRRAWEGMLSAEIRANYFADLSGDYRLRQRVATWTILVLSSGAAASAFYGGFPDLIVRWLRLVLPLLTVAVSLYLVVAENHKSAVDSADLHSRWNRLAGAYESLWENVYAEDAEERLNQLRDDSAELSKVGASFPNRKRAMLKWQAHVEREHAARIAA